MTTLHNILLADSHPVCRRGLAAILDTTPDMKVCGETDSATQVIKLIQRSKPSALVSGLDLAQGTGIQLIHAIRSQQNQLPILIMSTYDERLFAERVIRAGANGYLQKSVSSDEFISALRQVLRGYIYLSPAMSDSLLRAHLHGRVSDNVPSELLLSDREMEIYLLLGKGYTTKKIASELHLSPKTVDSHKEHIKDKLGITDNIMLLRRALTWEIQIHS